MANNQLLASDNFASGSLAAGWTNIPTISVGKVVVGTPNVTEANSLDTAAGQMWTALGALGDQTSEVTGTLAGGNVGTYVALTTRTQSGGSYSGYQATIAADGSYSIYRYDSGTGHSLVSGGAGAITLAAGDVYSFQAAGSAISLYQNFKRINYAVDATYASGYPGYFQQGHTSLANSKVLSWRGYNTAQQDGIWSKQGVSIAPIAGDLTQGLNNASVLYDTNPQLISANPDGKVFKAWVGSAGFAVAGNIFYFESNTGLAGSWTRKAAAVIASRNIPMVFKHPVTGVYYCYCQNNTVSDGTNSFSLFTSTNGVSFSNQTDSILGLGAGGSWDSVEIFNFAVVDIIAGTWYALYSGTDNAAAQQWSVGLATSSDGINWSKYGGNPVTSSGSAGGIANSGCFAKVGGLYYHWAQVGILGPSGSDHFHPSTTARYSSPDLINWTLSCHSVQNSGMFESLNALTGQCFANNILTVGNKTFLFMTSAESDVSGSLGYQISLATLAQPISSIVQFPEDAVQQIATDPFTSGAGDLSANWTLPTGGTKLKIIAGPYVEPTATSTVCQAVYTGASFGTNQYSEITIRALTGTLAQSLIWPTVLSSTTALTNYEGRVASPTATSDAAAAIYKRVAGTPTQIGPTATCEPQVGDVWRLSVFTGSDGFPVLSLFQNGFLILQVQDQSSTPLTTGNPGIQAYSSVAIADAQISLWAGGNSNVTPNYPSGASSSWLTVANQNFLRGLKH